MLSSSQAGGDWAPHFSPPISLPFSTRGISGCAAVLQASTHCQCQGWNVSSSLLCDNPCSLTRVKGHSQALSGATELWLGINTHYSDFFNYCSSTADFDLFLLSSWVWALTLLLAVDKQTDKRCVKSVTSAVLSCSSLIMKSSNIFWVEYWHLFWQCWLSVFIVIILEKGKAVWNAALGWVPVGIITCYLPLIPLQLCFLWCSLAAGFKPLFTAAQQSPAPFRDGCTSLHTMMLIKESCSSKIAQFWAHSSGQNTADPRKSSCSSSHMESQHSQGSPKDQHVAAVLPLLQGDRKLK